jgi:hypothetical protein
MESKSNKIHAYFHLLISEYSCQFFSFAFFPNPKHVNISHHNSEGLGIILELQKTLELVLRNRNYIISEQKCMEYCQKAMMSLIKDRFFKNQVSILRLEINIHHKFLKRTELNL